MTNVPSNSSRNVVMSNETDKYIAVHICSAHIQWPEKSDERQKSEAGMTTTTTKIKHNKHSTQKKKNSLQKSFYMTLNE